MPDPHAIVAIVGKPASGKSFCRNALARQLGWRSLDIADQGDIESGRWPRLLAELQSDDAPVIVESCASPETYRALLARVPSAVIEVAAPIATRRKRMSERFLTRTEQKEWLAMSRRPPRNPDIRFVSDDWAEPSTLLPLIRRLCGEHPADPEERQTGHAEGIVSTKAMVTRS